MLAHTNAFAIYRQLSQAHLNFVVLVCAAVPALRPELKDLASPLLHHPDHFKVKRDSKSQLSQYASSYQTELGRSTLITTFSYFESYIRGAIREIADFHGGDESFKDMARRRAAHFVVNLPPEMKKSKRKLQGSAKPVKKEKYEKYSRLLDKGGYHFPTELLAHYGVVNMMSKSRDRNGMRAWEIPDILSDCLLFPLSSPDRNLFETCRSLRNEIAHGKAPSVSFQDSLRYASKQHALAAKIDKHLIEHFFVLQKYL